MDKFEQMLKKIEARRIATMSDSGTRIEPAAPTCPICDDLGYITHDVPIDHSDFGKAFPCQCQAEKRRMQQEKTIRAMSSLEAFTNKTFDSFQPTRPGLNNDQNAVLRRAYELAYRYSDSPDGWLLLSGSYGSGKTHLAAAIANRRVSDFGEKVMMVTAPDLLDHLRATYGPSSEVAYDELFDRVRNTPLLVMDDLGAESPTPWAREKLYQVLNYRHSARLPTVITTNADIELMDGRIRSRLTDQALTQTVPMEIPDHRSPASQAELNLTNLDRYRSMTFDTFEDRRGEALTDEERQQFETLIGVARAYAEHPAGWLVFIGQPGIGKTHLASAIAHERKAHGDNLAFVVCSELTDYLRATFTPNSTISFDKRLHEIRQAPFLVLDNLQIDAHTSSWAREKLYDILTYRFDCNLPTVITTYQGKMDVRLASRIENKSRCTVPVWPVSPYRGGTHRRAARPRRTST